ncbi:GGDEF domain-containing protein [Gynuella sp.]|uniref:GGDEF domain-containing protein n=1 Tax=Gynuella sp. TaxID=2969146 RepID=UPI003D14396F
MRSLKTKLIVALIGSNLLVITLFALITPWKVQQHFIESAKQLHYQNFARMIERYIDHEHSWNTETDATRLARIALDNRPPNHADRPFNNLASGQRGSEQPADPSFQFALFDPSGRNIIGGKTYQPGEQVDQQTLTDADPIMINQKVVAYVLPSGTIPLTRSDTTYLNTLKESLLYATGLSLLILIPFGFWEGSKLVRSLKQLTTAVEKMSASHLEQQVDISTNDETGRLGQAFNAMNARLVEAYNRLEDSHATIAKQAEELKELSIRDSLTGLHNRRFFNEEVDRLHQEALRYHRPFCIVLGDVDHFKKINDRFSHATGDRVLQQVADILNNSLRDTDVLARYGGEEMVIALPGTTPLEAQELIERIRNRIENHPWHKISEQLAVTMSFGICDELDQQHFEHMLVLADEQLYLAKNEGRNQVRCLKQPSQTH